MTSIHSTDIALAGRWLARITGTLMVLFIAAFLIGEGPPPFTRMNPREQMLAVGMCLLFGGLILAWFWEGWGGAISLAGWVLFSIVNRRPAWDVPFLIPAAVGAIHVTCWWVLRGHQAGPRRILGSATVICLWAAFALFVLLGANEMFGMPPLMTPSVGSRFAGDWHGTPGGAPMIVKIAPDGSASGTIATVPFSQARLTGNRSWFGRLMNWRTEYLMQGTLSGEVQLPGGIAGTKFAAPLSPSGDGLTGSLFLGGPRKSRPVRLSLSRM